MRLAPALVATLGELGCVYSGGAGITVARSNTQWAVGPAVDVSNNTWAARGSTRLPNSVPTVGLAVGFDALFPVYRLDGRASARPTLGISGGVDLAPTTLTGTSAGLSYRVAPWQEGDAPSRFGGFAGALGAVKLTPGASVERHEVLPALFASIRFTLPLLEGGDGLGWEVAGTLGVRGYFAYGSGTDSSSF
jgi:hypothetical protein